MASPHSQAAVTTLVRDLHMLATLVQRMLEQQPLERTVGDRLSFSQLNLLKLVGGRSPNMDGGKRQPWLVSQLAGSLGVTAPAASQSISQLQRQGWLKVSRDRADARRRRVTLTAKASRAIDSYEAAKRSLLEETLADTRPAELQHWTTSLDALITCLLQRGGDAPCLKCGMYAEGACVAQRSGVECPVTAARS